MEHALFEEIADASRAVAQQRAGIELFDVTSFIRGRSAGVLASAAVTYRLTVLASRGTCWAFQRVRIIPVVMPPAIVAVD
ncbi:hypothetical protein [Streptomyces pinistramenti]|uniref:hypothetical protein n=1 Tax=Streptomyces pinistramenti TaxID=2884812 RepID=UPI001D07F1FD|nr:hypothetical protein [Streptomyces pinistramenti]MCB5909797.1 hypothetical protein [Streptomyces pinistramenti]